MGRAERLHKDSLMTPRDVARHLIGSCKSLRHFQSFMFGSSLYHAGSCDFDILIVGPPGEKLSQLKVELRAAGEELPLDILYMLPIEAEETRFIARTGCITLNELADC